MTEELLAQGSVKDIYDAGDSRLHFSFSDYYSVFDWGRMPDPIPHKGKALCEIAVWFFEFVQDAFSGKLKSHFLERHSTNAHGILVRRVAVEKPSFEAATNSYIYPRHHSEAPRLIPLEVLFRFCFPEGSSFLARHPERTDLRGKQLETPIVEFSTKLESQDRYLSDAEALSISGLSENAFRNLSEYTVNIAKMLRSNFKGKNLDLADGKLEWGIAEADEIFLVDSLGPDELRMECQGSELSKECIRKFYRKTPWFRDLSETKKRLGPEWKYGVKDRPPSLDGEFLNLVSEMYQALANRITGIKIFEVNEIEGIAGELKKFEDARK